MQKDRFVPFDLEGGGPGPSGAPLGGVQLQPSLLPLFPWVASWLLLAGAHSVPAVAGRRQGRGQPRVSCLLYARAVLPPSPGKNGPLVGILVFSGPVSFWIAELRCMHFSNALLTELDGVTRKHTEKESSSRSPGGCFRERCSGKMGNVRFRLPVVDLYL